MLSGDELSSRADSRVTTATAASDGRVVLWEQGVRVLRKHARLGLFIVAFAAVAAIGVALSLKDQYRAAGRLQVDPLDSGIKTLHEIQTESAMPDPDYLETQVQVLLSEGLAMRVIRVLHLDRQEEFVPQKVLASPKGPARPEIGLAGDTDFWKEQLDLADRTPAESAALGVFHRHLSVEPVRNSRLIEVSYESHDPRLAQLITNTLMSQYLEQNYRDRFTSTMRTSDWLSQQLNDLERKMQRSSQAVIDYQKRYGIVEEGDHDEPLTQYMVEINHQLSGAQADRMEAEASVRMIDMGNADGIPALRDDAVYQGLMTRYADARAELAQARAVYGDENSNVKKLENLTNELVAQVQDERNRVVARLREALASAQAREEMMLQTREKVRGEMGDVNSHFVQYSVLRSEATANADLYNTLQARLREAGIYAGLRSSNIRILDMAPKLQKPTGPARSLIVVFGVILGGLFAVALAFVHESFDNTIRTPDDIRYWVGLPPLAMLPSITPTLLQADVRPGRPSSPIKDPRAPDIVSAFPKIHWTRSPNAAAEAMRGLRATLLASKGDSWPRVILVSSASTGEGKTTVAVNLATVMGQRSQVCFVDADFRQPMAARAFGLTPSVGLMDVLNGAAPLERALIRVPNFPSLALLSGASETEIPADLVASDNWKALIEALKSRFDFVILDSPPMIPFSDARLLAAASDVVVLVGRYGVTTRTALARCAQLLQDVCCPSVGVVLNDIDLASPDYHYYNYGFSRVRRSDPYEFYSPHPRPTAGGRSPDSGDRARGAHG